jgi:hypothetical protein
MSEPYPHFLPELYNELYGCVAHKPATPSNLRRFFLLMLRGHWSDAENYGPDFEETLGCLEWAPDNAGKLGVELQGAKDVVTKQHMIWVSLGNFRTDQVVFGNRASRSEDNATQHYAMPCKAQLLVSHDAPSLDQAMDMAWSSFCFLMGFQDSILEGLGGDGAGFRVELVGNPEQRELAPKDRFRVDVGAALSLNVAVATTIESHKLKRVALTLLAQ